MSATGNSPVHSPLPPGDAALSILRNVGKAALADFAILGVATVGDLRPLEADDLYRELCRRTGRRHDPCVHDVFAAAIHQARTGEALDWWAFSPARKRRFQGSVGVDGDQAPRDQRGRNSSLGKTGKHGRQPPSET